MPNNWLAEDVVQEAFLTAFTNLNELRVPELFPAWLEAVIRSQCSQMNLRVNRDVSLEQLDDCGLLPMGEVKTPEDDLHVMRLLGHFDDALRSLPEHLRDICRQHYLLGLSTVEIAQATSLLAGTVKKRLHGARFLLQEKMLPYRGEEIFRVGYMPISDHVLAMVTEHLYRDRKLSLLLERYVS